MVSKFLGYRKKIHHIQDHRLSIKCAYIDRSSHEYIPSFSRGNESLFPSESWICINNN